MKRITKTIAASLLLACATLMVRAQESENKSAWSIKLQAGMTLATLAGDDADGVENKLSWDVGAEAEYRINPRLGLSIGLMYTNTGCKETDNKRSYQFDPWAELNQEHNYITVYNDRYTFQYLSFPVMANIYIVKGLALKLGVQLMVKTGANLKSHYTGNFKDGPDAEYKFYDEDQKHGLRKSIDSPDIAIPLGLSYEWKNVFLDARYHFGLESVIKDSDTRNRYLSVNLGYRFQL